MVHHDIVTNRRLRFGHIHLNGLPTESNMRYNFGSSHGLYITASPSLQLKEGSQGQETSD